MLNTCVYVDDDEVEMPAADSEFVFGGAIVPDGWEFTRDGAALGRGPDGRWASYAANVPRPYHYGISTTGFSSGFSNAFKGVGNYLYGAILEPSRTQLVLTTKPVVATFTDVTSTVDTTTQTPFGLGGRMLIANTLANAHGFNMYFSGVNRAGSVPDNVEVSGHLCFKPLGNMRRGMILAQNKAGGFKNIEFTTENGGSILKSAATWARIGQDTDGFFTVEFGSNVGAGTASAGGFHFNFQNDNGSRFFAGDGTFGVLIAYYGLEVGEETTTPILTSGSSVTRAEDVLKTSAAWMAQGPKSLGIRYTPMARTPQVILGTSGLDSIELSNSGASVSYSLTTSGANIGSLTGVVSAFPTVERTVVVTAGPNEFWLTQDGAKLTVDQSGDEPRWIDSLRLGGRPTGGFNGPVIVKQLKYWAQALDRETAAAFSADLTIPGVVPVRPVIDVQPSRTVSASVTSLVLNVALIGEPTGASISYRTVDGTAVAGVDYVETKGRLVFEQAENDAEITIPLLTRSLEQDRTFQVELFSPIGATIETDTCVVMLSKASPAAHAPLKYARFDTALSADWSFTRSTPGYARNSSGTWVSVAANQPRLHYSAAGDVGLLLEPASEQRVFESVTAWTSTNATRTTDTTTAVPTGNRSVKFRENAVLTSHKLGVSWTTTNPDWPTGDVTVYMIVKPVGTRLYYRFSVMGIDNVWKNFQLDFSGNGGAGSIIGTDTGIVPFVVPEPMWPGWFRIGMSRGQTTSAGVAPNMDVYPITSGDSINVQGDVNNGLDICHIQVEPLAFPTSPIPVTGQSAKTVRAADVLKATGGWQNRNSFALGVKFKRLNTDPASQRIVQFRDGAPSVDDFGILTVSGVIQAPLTTGTNFQGAINGATNATGTYMTALASIDTTRYALFADGVKSGEIAMAGRTMPELVEHLRFGSKEQDGSQAAPIVLHSTAYWTVGMSDEEGNVFSADLSGVPPGGSGPDPLPVVNIPLSMTVREGNVVEVPITKVGNGACSVLFKTTEQTAKYNLDYMGVGPITVSFAENESTKLVPVTTLADADSLNEPIAGEKFGISIYSPVGCGLGVATGTVTIAELPKISVPSALSVKEGGTIAVTVTKLGFGACSFSYRTRAGTATLGSDYVNFGPLTGTFAENETTKTINVVTVDDSAVEPSETVDFVLVSATDAKLGNSVCTITILDAGAEVPPQGQLYQTPVTFANTSASGVKNDFGIGGDPYYVTTLADNPSSPAQGSLRHAMLQSNRVVVFEVGGVFKNSLTTRMRCSGHNLLIAGETAPHPGVIIQGGTVDMSSAENVCLRHVMIETGYDTTETSNSNTDCMQFTTASGQTIQNVWVDHCGMLWGNDEAIQLWRSEDGGTIENVSITNCMMAETLYRPENLINPDTKQPYKGHWEAGEPERDHNYGMLISSGCKRIDMQYNLFSEMYWRQPQIQGNVTLVIANQVVMNCRLGATLGPGFVTRDFKGPDLITVEGYLCISGPNTGAYHTGFKFHNGSGKGFGPVGTTKTTNTIAWPVGTKVWAKNLYAMRGALSTYNMPLTTVGGTSDAAGLTDDEKKILSDATVRPIDIPTAPVVALSMDDLYERTLLNVGPRPKQRFGHAKRIIDKLRDKTGKWVNHQSEVGGFTVTAQTNRNLRNGTAKFADGSTPIQPYPTPVTDKAAVRAWLRRFLDDVQYD